MYLMKQKNIKYYSKKDRQQGTDAGDISPLFSKGIDMVWLIKISLKQSFFSSYTSQVSL